MIVYIMLALVCVWSLSVLLQAHNLKSAKTLNYSLLNQQQTISLSLESYFKVPSQVIVDLESSTPQIDEILDIQFTEKAVSQISSLELVGKMPDNSSIYFSNRSVIMERSIFNYPNKVFLMDQNYVFSLRYQVSTSDNTSYIRAFRINTTLNCTNIQIQQFNSSYYLFVACSKVTGNNNPVSIYPYKFTEPKSGLLDQLVGFTKQDFKFSSFCPNITLYAFDQLYTTSLAESKVLLGCSAATKSNLQLFVLWVTGVKGVDILSGKTVINDNLAYCVRESSKLIQYQKGFLAVTGPALHYYSYNPSSSTTSCTTNFLTTTDSKFITSIKDGDIQYVYVIYQDKIIIKQSYSPNYGVVSIDQKLLSGMQVQNYCVAQRFLGLLYRNSTHYALLTFDLRTSYPKLVDIVFQSHSYSFAFLYSVKNFLSKGNYYLFYDSVQNLLKLNCYIGYELTITIKNSSLALGTVILGLTDKQDGLLLNFTFRDFDDVTLEKSSDIDQKVTFQNVLTLNLSNYVNGPLGRFYTYPNSNSLFQYVNYLSQLSVQNQLAKIKEKLTTFSINNMMSIPLITFFFQNTTILTCELDFSTVQRQAQLSQCKTTKTRKSNMNYSKQVVVISKQSFLQFDTQLIEMCQLNPMGQYECYTIFQKFNDLVGIKLVRYSTRNVVQIIQLIIYCKKEILYCRLNRYYPNLNFSTSVYYHIFKQQLPELSKMSILDLHVDTEYTSFLVLRFLSDDNLGEQKIVVYDRPYIRPNTTSNLIGHVIQAFQKIALQAFFSYDNLLILVTNQAGSFVIRQFKITKQYRLRFSRIYPLYGFKLKVGGKHFQDQNFIFLQIIDQNTPYYLVYAPLLPTCNVLSHKIEIKSSKIYFAQQIDSVQNSSLMLNGYNIVGITVPNFILRLIKNNNPSDSQLGVTLIDFNVSVVDSLNTLSVLNYQFSYNEKEEQINFLGPDVIQLTLNSSISLVNLTIQAKDVYGFVQDYNFSLPDTPICNGFKLERVDVFTKQQCLLYYQSQQYGILNDFVVVWINSKEVEVLVTDTRLFCVADKQLPTIFNPSFLNLSDCRFQTSNNQILMSCMNSTTFYRSIFNITVTYTNSSCQVAFLQINIPQDLAYQDYDIQFTRDVIMLEVPIRMQQNKIYYKAQLQHNGIAKKSLIVKKTDNQIYQSQFQTVDSTLSSEVFLLLQDGIGVFNLSDSNDLVFPALWISSDRIKETVGNEPFAYLMLRSLQKVREQGFLIVQLGTTYRSFEIQIKFSISNESNSQQTVYLLQRIQVILEYKQYLNCRNGISSYSQSFQNLIVKICNYEPKQQNVFANFISINNETANSLIQFYNKSGNIIFPFRIDVIYSNPLSNHQFAIINNTLVVGSLFNMLCYYVLTPTITWSLAHNNTESKEDEICEANLTLFNKHNQLQKKMVILYDADSFQEKYWSVGVFYIQRVVLFLILANTIRLIVVHRNKVSRTKRKESGRLHTSRFEVMVRINSKKSI